MKELLAPNGTLAGVLFDTDFPFEGPPFGGHSTEYQPLFEKHFRKASFEPCSHSAAPRAGTECLMVCRKNNYK